MTTYNTIKSAFANGTGDVFYTKNNTFICFSRHDDRDNQMIADGFTRMTYSEVIAQANTEPGTKEVLATCNITMKAAEPAKSYSNDTNGRDGYYDEFPDAYGQNL